MADALLIGLDIGTTAVKGGLFDPAGSSLARHAVPYPTARPEPRWVEQDPEDWTRAIETILGVLLRAAPPSAIAAIGLCSQVNTHVFVDSAGVALAPAIVWQDGRAAAIGAELDSQAPAERKREWWGAELAIGVSSALSRMAWVARHRPEIWRRTAHVLSPKEYCLLKLTGRLAADPLGQFDVVDRSGRYIPDLLALVPGAAEKLPPLFPIDAVIGAASGTLFPGGGPPVVNGTMDGWASLPGAGVSRPGQGAYLSGTSEIVALASDRQVGAPGIISFPPVAGWRAHAGPTQSGGDSLRWFARATGHTIDAVLEAAATADRAVSRVVFLPHLEGERAPLWDPHSRGAFVGMSSDAGFGALAVSVLEGVAFSARLLFEAAQAAAGMQYSSLFLAGGGARSDLWCQIRADILGVALERNAFLDAGTLGAAVIAGAGLGVFATLADGAAAMRRPGRRFAPDPALKPRYDDLFGLYQETYRALCPIHAGLGRLPAAKG